MRNFLNKFFLSLSFLMTTIGVFSQQQIFYDGFESGDFATQGWTQETNGATTLWSIGNSGVGTITPFEGNSMAKLFSSLYQSPVKLVTPAVDITNIAEPYLTFYMASQRFNIGTRDTLKLYYKALGATSWVLMRSLRQNSNGWQRHRIRIKDYTTVTNLQFAFEYAYANGKGIALDSVRVYAEKTCYNPTGFEAFNITNTSAVLRWTGSSYTQTYTVKVSTTPIATAALDGATADIYNGNVHMSLLSLPILLPNTVYYCYVKADCGGGDISGWSLANFRTRCDPIPEVNIPTTLVENFDSYSTNAYPTCWLRRRELTGDWTNATVSQNDYMPSVQTVSAKSGTKALKIAGYYHDNQALVTPRYAVSYAITQSYGVPNINQYQVTFWAKAEDATSTMHVGVMTNPDDLNTFEEVRAINVTSAGTWQKFTVYLLNVQNNGKFVAFKVDGRDGNADNLFYIDDFILEKIPACPPPTNFKFTGLTPQGAQFAANFAWDRLYPNHSFNIAVYLSPSNPTMVHPYKETRNINGIAGSVSGLDSYTRYYAYIQNSCESEWVGPVEFMTPLAPSTIPYNDGFEASSLWVLENGSQANKWVMGNAVKKSGNRALYVSNNNGIANAYTPAASSHTYAIKSFRLTQGQRVEFSFMWKMLGNADLAYLNVFIVPTISTTQPMAGTTPDENWVKLNTAPMSGNNTWQRFVGELQVPITGDYNLVFHWRNEGSTSNDNPPAAIDDLSIKLMTCSLVENLTATNVSETSATINWMAGQIGSASQWLLWYRPITSPDTVGIAPIVLNTNTYTITGLSPLSTYIVYVVSKCGNNTYSFAQSTTFQTRQIAEEIPFIDSFEGANTWYFANGTQTNKWIIGTADKSAGTKSMYISNNNSQRQYTVAGTLDPTSYVYAYKTFVFDENEVYNLSFKYKSYGEANTDLINLFLVPDELHESIVAGNPNGMAGTENNPPPGWIRIGTRPLYESTGISNWKNFSENFSVPTSGRYKIVYAWKNNSQMGSPTGAGAVDEVSLQKVNCPAPLDIDVTLVGNTANVTWTGSSDAISWTVQWGTSESSLSAPVTVNTPSFAATPINTATETTYFFKITTICANSSNSKTHRYITATPFPYYTSFETPDDNNWKRRSTSSINKWVLGSNSQAVFRGDKSLYISKHSTGADYEYSTSSSTVAYAYRAFNLKQGETYKLNFNWKAKGESNYDYLRVFLVPSEKKATLDSPNASTIAGPNHVPNGWIDLVGGKLNDVTSWQNKDLTYYSPQKGLYYLVFVWINNSYSGDQPPAAIDEVAFYPYYCDMVHGIAATSISMNGSIVTWRSTNGIGYDIKVSTTEIAPESQLADVLNEYIPNNNDTTFNLNGLLQPGTVYYVYIRSRCNNTSNSFYNLTPYKFSTLCASVSVPYSDDFNSYDNGLIPNCWTSLVQQEDPSSGNFAPEISNSTIGGQANKYLKLETYYVEDVENTKLFAIFPQFSTPIDQLQVEFDVIGAEERSVSLMVSPSNSDPSMASNIANYAASPEGNRYNVVLNGTPTGNYLMFVALGDVNGTGIVAIDNINVSLANMCMKPNSISHSNITTNSAEISWTSSYYAQQTWQVVVTTVDISDDMSQLQGLSATQVVYNQNVTGNRVVVTGLQPNLRYYYYVRKVCANNTYSDWYSDGNTYSFLTNCLANQKCTLNINKKSNTGTGWGNDTKLELYQNGEVVHTFTFNTNVPNSFSEVQTISLCPDQYEFVFTKASNRPYVSFEVTINNNVEFSTTTNDKASEAFRFSLLPNSCAMFMCPEITNVVFSNTINSINASWTGTASSYTVQLFSGTVIDNSGIPLQTQNVTTNNVSFTGLNVNTTYTIFVRASCVNDEANAESGWVNVTTCTLMDLPADTPPISSNFNDVNDNSKWNMFTSANSANKWFIGSAAKRGDANDKGLYISNNNGVSNAYTTSSTSYSYATRYLNLTGGKDYHIAFDWKGAGEARYDLLRAFLIPGSDSRISEGYHYGMDGANNTPPANWIDITGSPMQGSASTWRSVDTIVNLTVGGKYFFAFFWKNNGSGGSQPPAAVDNLNIFEEQCAQPHSLTVSNVTTTTATVSWTGTASNYDVRIFLNSATVDPTTTTPLFQSNGQTATTYNVTGLTPNRTYVAYLRSNCTSPTSQSLWKKVIFTTDFVVGTLPLTSDFENENANLDWIIRSSNVEGNAWTIGTSVKNGGQKSIYVSNNYGTSNAYSTNVLSYSYAFRAFPLRAAAEYKVRFDWKGAGEASCDLARVFLIPESYKQTVVAGDANGMSGRNNIAPQGWVDIGGVNETNILQGKTTWQNVSRNVIVPADGVYYFALFWKNDASSGTNPPVAIDNIIFDSLPCPSPRNVSAVTTPTTAVFTWTGGAAQYHVQLVNNSTSPASVVDQQDVVGFTVSYNSLIPTNNYTFTIKAICDPVTSTESEEVSFNFLAINSEDKLPINANFEDIADNLMWKYSYNTGVNKWHIGSASKKTGTNGMYISNVETGNINAYDISSITYAYAYRKVRLEVGEAYAYGFDWKAYGESTYDLLRAFVIPATVDISNGASYGMTGSSNMTPNGWIDLNPAGGKLNLQTDWQRIDSLGLRVPQTDDYYLAFFWKNDGSAGSQPPASIDNFHFSEISSRECPPDVVCQGYDYNQCDFYIPVDSLRQLGTHQFTKLFHNPATGAVENLKLELTVIPGVENITEQTVCEDEEIEFFGRTIKAKRSQKFHHYMMASNGCDSIITLDLTVYPKYAHLVDTAVNNCDLPLTINGQYFDVEYPEGTWLVIKEYSSVFGCDSNTTYVVHVSGPCNSLDVLRDKNILFTPNPIKAGDMLNITGDFTAEELAGLKVEVISYNGSVVNIVEPTTYPIQVGGFRVSGVYVLRLITGKGDVIYGKVIVK